MSDVVDVQAYNDKEDASKLKKKVMWEEPASRGRRSLLRGRHAVFTDADFKLGDRRGGGVLVPIRDSVTPTHENQCPLVAEQPVFTFLY